MPFSGRSITSRPTRPMRSFLYLPQSSQQMRRKSSTMCAASVCRPSYESRVLVKNGGLLSYGPNLNEMFRRVAYYVDRIIKGAKPSELPIERPTQFELVVNTKTAKQLGLDVPPTLLIRADEVIE